MTTASTVPTGSVLVPERISSVTLLLRLEGLAVAVISALFYARIGANWWLFAGLWLAPDLSMLGYLAGSCRGARIYNAFHTYALAAIPAVAALLLHQVGFLSVALIWANHIGVDRMLGFGLKFGDGFSYTHLGSRKQNAS